MNQKMIIDAYCRMRTIDNTIPDDVLDFMKEAALEKLERIRRDNEDNEEDLEGSALFGRYGKED